MGSAIGLKENGFEQQPILFQCPVRQLRAQAGLLAQRWKDALEIPGRFRIAPAPLILLQTILAAPSVLLHAFVFSWQ